jgi:hypothetical protein
MVPLPLEDLSRLPEHVGGPGASPDEHEHLSQVGKRVSLGVEEIRLLDARDCLAGEGLASRRLLRRAAIFARAARHSTCENASVASRGAFAHPC